MDAGRSHCGFAQRGTSTPRARSRVPCLITAFPVLLNGPDVVNNLGMASSGMGSENARTPDKVKAP